MADRYIVIKPEINGAPADYRWDYYSDLVQHSTRDAAVKHGCRIYGHDDWLILTLRNGVAFRMSWMHEERDDPDELAEIARYFGWAVRP